METNIVVVDFAGTLIRAEIIEEANVFRAHILQKALPSKEKHAHPEAFYKVNREFVEKLTGLSSSARVQYRENDLQFMDLSGEDVQNQISTTLFQVGMYIAAKKYGKNIFQDGIVEQLLRIKKKGYALAIISGVRTDIISGVLQIAKCPVTFDFMYGQPPKLGVDNQAFDVMELQKKGKIMFSIGDKMSDLERVKGCKNIFVTWGHPSGGEEDSADFTIHHPKELWGIIL